MKATNSKLVKTSFEENNDICNYQLGQNYSDLSDDRTNPGTVKSRNFNTPKSEKEKREKSKKRSNSKNKSRKNSIDSTRPNNNNLIELVDSLKEKLSVYENEMRCLIEQKVQMQIQINTLQLNSYQNLKKSGKLKKSGDMTHSNDSISDLRSFQETNNGLRNELNNMNNQLTKQRKLLDQNFSILNDSVIPDSIFKKVNQNIIEIQKINCFTIPKKNQIIQKESLQSFSINSSFSKQEEVIRLEQQREKMLEEINNLKNELIYLMEAQMQSQTSNISQDNKQEKKEEKLEEKPNKCTTENNLKTETTSSSHKITENSEQEDIKIPPLQNIFLHDKKLLVLDQEYFVWHLKKCRKYKSFVEKNNQKYGGNKADIFNAYYEDSFDNNDLTHQESLSNIKESKGISQSNQHMYIAENYAEDNENEIPKEEAKQDIVEKIENKNAIQIDDFDISRMSDMSNFVNDVELGKKPQSMLAQNSNQKNEEKEPNTSLDLSDDG